MSDESITVIAVKKADKRDAVIFRLHNNTDHAVDTARSVNDTSLPLSFGRFEVKTVMWEKNALTEEYIMLI